MNVYEVYLTNDNIRAPKTKGPCNNKRKTCKKCNKVYSNRVNLLRHMRVNHHRETPMDPAIHQQPQLPMIPVPATQTPAPVHRKAVLPPKPSSHTHSNDIKQENRDIGYSDKEGSSFPSIQFEEDYEGGVPLMEYKTEVEEEQEISEQKQRAVETNNIKQENRDIGYSDKEGSSFPSIQFEEDYEGGVPLMEYKTEVEEEQEISEQKQRAVKTNRTDPGRH